MGIVLGVLGLIVLIIIGAYFFVGSGDSREITASGSKALGGASAQEDPAEKSSSTSSGEVFTVTYQAQNQA